jgi:ribosomal protein S18 acetylase RimI-like enzyme
VAILIRPANRGDALHVAAIIDIASHGIDLERWIAWRDGEHSVISAGRRAVLEDPNLTYHFSQAHVLEVDGEVGGGLIGGLVTETITPEDDDPPHLVPLIALEGRLPGYWSIIAVTVYAEFRGRGLASILLDHAMELAAGADAKGLSLVVEDNNFAALALYRRRGFREAERLPWIGYDGRSGPQNWLMLRRDR